MKDEIARGTNEDDLAFAFNLMDTNNDGFLDVSDVQFLFEMEGVKMDKTDVMDMMLQSGTSSGIMDFNEFKKFAKKIDVHSKLTSRLDEQIA